MHETHYCSGYYIYLSSSREYSQASFYLCQQTSVLLLVGDKLALSLRKEASNAGTSVNFHWSDSYSSGLTQRAYRRMPDDIYTPLYNLTEMEMQ